MNWFHHSILELDARIGQADTSSGDAISLALGGFSLDLTPPDSSERIVDNI